MKYPTLKNGSPSRTRAPLRTLIIGLSLTAVASVMSACEGGSAGSAADPAHSGSKSTQNPSGSNATVGSTCRSDDANQICLALKYVVYKDSSGKAVSSEATAQANLEGINRIWQQCGIAFQIEKYEAVNPADEGLSFSGMASHNQTSAIRNAYEENDTLLLVTTGAWGAQANAWTAMPGSAPYGAVMEATIASGYSEIYAHEIGHYLNLDHISDSSNNMSSVIAHSSTRLSASQCEEARATATSFWTAMNR